MLNWICCCSKKIDEESSESDPLCSSQEKRTLSETSSKRESEANTSESSIEDEVLERVVIGAEDSNNTSRQNWTNHMPKEKDSENKGEMDLFFKSVRKLNVNEVETVQEEKILPVNVVVSRENPSQTLENDSLSTKSCNQNILINPIGDDHPGNQSKFSLNLTQSNSSPATDDIQINTADWPQQKKEINYSEDLNDNKKFKDISLPTRIINESGLSCEQNSDDPSAEHFGMDGSTKYQGCSSVIHESDKANILNLNTSSHLPRANSETEHNTSKNGTRDTSALQKCTNEPSYLYSQCAGADSLSSTHVNFNRPSISPDSCAVEPRIVPSLNTHDSHTLSVPSRSLPETPSQQPPYSSSAPPLCMHLSSLYCKKGKICTVFGKRYILTSVEESRVLVSLSVTVLESAPIGCKILWRNLEPVPLSEIVDSSEVNFDAVVPPNSVTFHAVVVWQGVKPTQAVEPSDKSYMMIKSLVLVGSKFTFRKSTGSVNVYFEGSKVKSEFVKDVVFVDGKKASDADILSMELQERIVFAKVCKFMKFGSQGTFKYICAYLWCGTKPSDNALPDDCESRKFYKILSSNTYEEDNHCSYFYYDAPSTLKKSTDGYVLKACIGDEEASVPLTGKENYLDEKERSSVLDMQVPVTAHLHKICKSGTLIWTALLLRVSSLEEIHEKLQVTSWKEDTPINETLKSLPQQPKPEDPQILVKSEVNEKDVSKDSHQSTFQQSECATMVKRAVDQLSVQNNKNDNQDSAFIVHCCWHFASISQAVLEFQQCKILVKHENFYVKGKRVPQNTPLSNCHSKNAILKAVIQPLSRPVQALGRTITYHALAAWQGKKPQHVNKLLQENSLQEVNLQHRSQVQKFLQHCYKLWLQENGESKESEAAVSTSFENGTCLNGNFQIRIQCSSAPPKKGNEKKYKTSTSTLYVGGCAWKFATISQGIILKSSKKILVKHESFYTATAKVLPNNPLAKFACKNSLTHAEVVELIPARTILGCLVTHKALVAWEGKKPPDAFGIVQHYITTKQERMKNALTGISVTITLKDGIYFRNVTERPVDCKLGNVQKVTERPVSVKTKIVVNSKQRNVKEVNKRPDDRRVTSAKAEINKIQDITGVIKDILGDYGILHARHRLLPKGEAFIGFHRSVVFVKGEMLHEHVPLVQYLMPFQMVHCIVQKFKMKIGKVPIEYKAELVWKGKKPSVTIIKHQQALESSKNLSLNKNVIKQPSNKKSAKENKISSGSITAKSTSSSTGHQGTIAKNHNKIQSLSQLHHPSQPLNGVITGIFRKSARLKTKSGGHLAFKRGSCCLYGIPLQNVGLNKVLRIGLPVEYQLSKSEGQKAAIERVWVGGVHTPDPLNVADLVFQWCSRNNIQHMGTVNILMKEAALWSCDLSPLAPVDESDEKVIEICAADQSSQ